MANNKLGNIGIIILAAGSSVRLGKPKQLLQFDGQSLLQRLLNVSNDVCAGAVFVVLGENADLAIKEVEGQAKVVVNDEYEEGMASSIRCGIRALSEQLPAVCAALILVCDQPFVSHILLNQLITIHYETKKPIVTSRYANTFGPPTLFHRSMFEELLQLKGDVGARRVIQQHIAEVEFVDFEQGDIDIDTEEDYKKLLK